MVARDRLTVLDAPPRRSRIVDDRTRHHAPASVREWMVGGRCPGRGPPELFIAMCTPMRGIPRYCRRRDRRSGANCAIAPGPRPAPKGSVACDDALDAATVLMDRSPDPPAAGPTAESSGRAPWRP